ncbi:MAG: hypothetical protein AAFQ82_21715 [Myxococcota bacterium]
MWRRQIFDVECTVSISHRFEDLSAHVDLDGDVELEPGDEVKVHGSPIHAAYGECVTERRTATVTKAGWPARVWARLMGDLECLELLEVDFTERRTL